MKFVVECFNFSIFYQQIGHNRDLKKMSKKKEQIGTDYLQLFKMKENYNGYRAQLQCIQKLII